MNAEEWKRVRPLLESALELRPSERSGYLAEACSNSPLRLELESLIAQHEEAGSGFMNVPAVAHILAEEEIRFRLHPGERVGPYEIVGEIARGGMGAVYRAVRADGQYTQEVALKIVQAGFGAERTAARFRNERQILASLDHPNIAKLLDGGATPDGLPYFVMELIDGLSITDYCDQQKLSIEARLKLFRKVCEAVQYAHQRLVVHRDIKPSNILVTTDGVPKLLDFGIAKVLDRNPVSFSSTQTVIGRWMMTPEYASPEQIRGEVVTTASDIYSLGLVLYQLLAGRPAYRFSTRTPQDIAQVICDKEPQRPSQALLADAVAPGDPTRSRQAADVAELRGTTVRKLKKRLRCDLDNITLMAIRKEASRRYISADQFAEDIRRSLEQIPIAAHSDVVWYRASKFVGRYRTGVIASAVAALLLLGGLVVTLYEARAARQQAVIAREQRARAERRFNDVRALANSLIFEVHDSIKDLPGATPARKILLDRALQYLDSLSQEASGDAALQRELATAYDRVGDLLGYTGAANLGDFPGALKSYQKALNVREAAAASNPDNVQIQSDLLSDYFRLAFVLEAAGENKTALKSLQQGLPIGQRLAATLPEPKYRDWLAGLYWKSGNISLEENDPSALEDFRQSVAIRESIALAPNADPAFRTHLAADYVGLARSLEGSGDLSHAAESLTKALRMLEALSAADPNNATLREYLGEATSTYALFLEKRGDLSSALVQARKAHALFQALLSADRSNSLARDNSVLTDLSAEEILVHQEKASEAIPEIRKTISIFESFQKKNRYEIAGQASAYATLGKAYLSLSSHDPSAGEKTRHLLQARSWLQKSLQTSGEIANSASQEFAGSSPASLTEHDLAICNAALAKLPIQQAR